MKRPAAALVFVGILAISSCSSTNSSPTTKTYPGLADYLNPAELNEEQAGKLHDAISAHIAALPSESEVIFEHIRGNSTTGYYYEAVVTLPFVVQEFTAEAVGKYAAATNSTVQHPFCYHADDPSMPDDMVVRIMPFNSVIGQESVPVEAGWKPLYEEGGIACGYTAGNVYLIPTTIPIRYSSDYTHPSVLDRKYAPGKDESLLYTVSPL